MINMSELKRKIINWIAWIALIVGIVMILWRIFGNSPTDLQVVSPFIVFGLAKVWEINNDVKDFKHEVRSAFSYVKKDMKIIKGKM